VRLCPEQSPPPLHRPWSLPASSNLAPHTTLRRNPLPNPHPRASNRAASVALVAGRCRQRRGPASLFCLTSAMAFRRSTGRGRR
jgi:hypothetical protein